MKIEKICFDISFKEGVKVTKTNHELLVNKMDHDLLWTIGPLIIRKLSCDFKRARILILRCNIDPKVEIVQYAAVANIAYVYFPVAALNSINSDNYYFILINLIFDSILKLDTSINNGLNANEIEITRQFFLSKDWLKVEEDYFTGRGLKRLKISLYTRLSQSENKFTYKVVNVKSGEVLKIVNLKSISSKEISGYYVKFVKESFTFEIAKSIDINKLIAEGFLSRIPNESFLKE